MLFGSTQPAAPSLFGQPQPAGQGTSLFNQPHANFSLAASQSFPPGSAGAVRPSGGLFGSTAGSTPSFGMAASAAPTSSLFGSTSTSQPGGFFSSTPGVAPGGSLFGSNPAPTSTPGTSLFGQPSSQVGASGAGLFGANPAPSLFGPQPQPAAGGLFGSTASAAPSTSLFGGSSIAQNGMASGSLFGSASTAAPAGGGLWGNPSSFSSTPAAPTVGFGMGAPSSFGGMGGMGGQQKGTAGIQFQKVKEPESGNFFVHFLKMDQFRMGEKSTEETRFEDYQLRKAGQLQFPKKAGMGGGSVFGAAPGFGASQGSSLWGQTSAAAPGTSLFGGSNPSSGLFSAAPAGGSLFGGPTTSMGGAFGTSPAPGLGAPAPSTGLFGQSTSFFGSNPSQPQPPAQSSLFGGGMNPAASTGTSLFGGAASGTIIKS